MLGGGVQRLHHQALPTPNPKPSSPSTRQLHPTAHSSLSNGICCPVASIAPHLQPFPPIQLSGGQPCRETFPDPPPMTFRFYLLQ